MHISIVFLVVFSIVLAGSSQACEFCTIAFMGKKEKAQKDQKGIFTAQVLFEHQDWKEIPAATAHELHHQGHHAHDKQSDEIIHTLLTAQVSDRLSLDVDIPYVWHHFIEIDSHAHLGENQTSQGLGDIVITGDYRLIQDPSKSFGIISGLKAPTGVTDEHTSFGALIEPELQPGSGSLDYIGGLSGSLHPAGMDLNASVIYIHRTEGEQDFRFGDLLSVSFYAGKVFEFKDKIRIKTGVMVNNQLEKKHNDEGGDIKDSGGYTMLVGPQLSVGYSGLSVEFTYFAPAIQNLGGQHQELDTGIWVGAVAVKF